MSTLSIVDLLKTSIAMDVLLLMSVVTVTFAIERWWYFSRTGCKVGPLLSALKRHVSAGDDARALETCAKENSGPARVAEAVLKSGATTREDLEHAASAAVEKESVEMERNLIVLGTMSNVAPLMGLFGTVMGIIRSFRDIAVTGSGGSSVIAMGVSEALLTTAVGIVIAVIATMFYNGFIRRVRVRNVQMEEVTRAVLSEISKRSVKARQDARQAGQSVQGGMVRTGSELREAS